MTVTVTLMFASASAAAAALSRIDAPAAAAAPSPVIDYMDRPDVGAPEAPLPPAVSPEVARAALVFGGAVAPAAPTLVPPAPVPSAPTVATAPTAAPGAAETDKTGLIWDARIHASTKTKKADGTWTARRNVDDTVRATIEAELRSGLAAPAAAVPAAPVLAAVPTPPAPPAVALPGPPAAGPETFPAYMARLGEFYANRPVETHTKMAEALAPYGLTTIGQLAGRPDLIPQVDAVFQALMAA